MQLTPLLLAVATAGTRVADVPNPRPRGSWVADQADVLSGHQEAILDRRIDRLHADTDVEIAVVTLQDVDTTPKDFATELFRHWGIGDAQTNNGLLVLLVLGQRRLEMETGYGLEPVLPDGWLGTMQRRVMVPRFKVEEYGQGLVEGLAAVDQRVRARIGPDGLPTPEHRAPAQPQIIELLGVLGGAGALVASGAGWAIRRRRRTCPHHGVRMTRLSETEDDAHLDEGQQLEEAIGSIDYHVYVCPRCEHSRTFPSVKWFTGYSDCPACRYRTRTTTSTVEVAATTVSSGRRRFDEHCSHCGFSDTYTRTIPRVSTSSSSGSSGWSSSSSGGGSFGGGSSGGGGAGSSW
ncbi:MAG: TPM domain-containing protein [Myxococcales bacterium]|nr:TPM domain-containing protein [Myxococcales bacterium]